LGGEKPGKETLTGALKKKKEVSWTLVAESQEGNSFLSLWERNTYDAVGGNGRASLLGGGKVHKQWQVTGELKSGRKTVGNANQPEGKEEQCGPVGVGGREEGKV